jgi:hypothetical protein
MKSLLAELLNSLVLGGHNGYGKEIRESAANGEGGIATAWIVAVAVLAVGTIGLLVCLSSSDTKAKLRRVAPGLFIAAVMATPLMVWASTSGGDDQSLIVERATSPTGTPELIVSLGEDDLNSLDTTNGKRAVRVQCLGRGGQMVLEGAQKWPFATEPGYDYPHAHQAATAEQLRGADRCRLDGTHVRLEADVGGAPSD